VNAPSGRGRAIALHAADNVLVALDALPVGSPLGDGLISREAVPSGHKLARRAIAAGEAIVKLGQTMGFASAAIAAGNHVHVHNVALHDFERQALERGETVRRPAPAAGEASHFQGYRRADDRAGTRNYIGIVATVNCAATVARAIAAQFSELVLADFPRVDGVAAFAHGSGCGMTRGDGLAILQRTLAGFARHPNLGGVLVLGLGCEVNQGSELFERYGLVESELCQFATIQELGGTRAAIADGVRRVREMLPLVNRAERAPIPVSELSLGLKCGGSDGYSGISANPALGVAADLLVAAGGTVILSETPEIYGAEHLLYSRARSPEVAERLRARIGWWQEYLRRHGAEMDNNPSPGNKSGGISTILEKSLGAVAKSGTSALSGVFEYAEPIRQRGLVFMDSPGYDPCSVTGQIASGANVVCFTTGRGSVFGSKPVPTLKLSTNTALFERMGDDIDVNCGTIIDGSATIEEVGQQILREVIAVASGKRSRSEDNGLGNEEFVPWILGATV
jgi:altronate hydrolase